MAIKVNANMSLGAAEFLDARQSVETLDELLALNTNIIPDGFECYVKELDVKYRYRSDYSEANTGNWKKVESNSGDENSVMVATCNIAFEDDDTITVTNLNKTYDELVAASQAQKGILLKGYVTNTVCYDFYLIQSVPDSDVIVFTCSIIAGPDITSMVIAVFADGTTQGQTTGIDFSDFGGGLVVTCEYDADIDGVWTVSNVSETYDTISQAITAGQDVILKAFPIGDTTSPYILVPTMCTPMGVAFSVIMADDREVSGMSVLIASDDSVTVGYNSIAPSELQSKLVGTEGQIVGFDVNGNAIAVENVKFVPALTTGTKIGTLEINGQTYDLYCTSYGVVTTSTNGLMSAADKTKLNNITASADSVAFTRSYSSGTKIGTITINGTATDIYMPKPPTFSLSGTTLTITT